MNDGPAVESLLALAEAAAPSLPGAGHPWLARRRETARAHFAELGLPTTREEDWRFTPLDALARLSFEAAQPPAETPDPVRLERATRCLGTAHRIVFVNGRFAAELSALADLPEGLAISPLACILEDEPERARGLLGQLADPKQSRFTALNTAAAADGLFLETAPGTRIRQPVHAVHLQLPSPVPHVSHPRDLVRIGEGSELTLVEHHLGADAGASLTNSVSEIVVERGAALEHLRLQDEGAESVHLGVLHVRQATQSRYRSHAVSLGARLARLEIRCELMGELAECTLNGLYLGRGTQLVDHHTTIDHAAAQTTSREAYRGILDERARGVFHGRIHVRPGAQRIDAAQTNHNLLLSDGALLRTKPQLEIYADDVRCSHGATVGRLDKDALFYLRTRGLAEAAARALLTFGFASELLSELPVASLRTELEARVLDWIPEARL
ncbi:MAG: Fe-S cluster assembly protein SufD [Myxococcota bacterium]